MNAGLPAPSDEGPPKREYRAKFREQFKDWVAVYDPDNDTAWIESDTTYDIQQ